MAATRIANKNILFIIADNLGKHTGRYGTKSIQTPNIDMLAAQGIRFDIAFASTASCSTSRSVIYTGLHTYQNGQYGHTYAWNHFATFNYIGTAPKIFNDLGYQTGIIGKVHVAPDSVYP
jgi:N-sulfoglucosamine sulfohydrolase